MDKRQLKDLTETVLKETKMYSPEAVVLMMATALHESEGLLYIKQKGMGPARSFWQVEPFTAYDHFKNYVNHRPNLRFDILRTSYLPGYFLQEIQEFEMEQEKIANVLERNIAFACCMARLKYKRDKAPIPTEPAQLAEYWGRVYQTSSDPKKMHKFGNDMQKYRLLEIV